MRRGSMWMAGEKVVVLQGSILYAVEGPREYSVIQNQRLKTDKEHFTSLDGR